MPVQKFRSFEEARDALWGDPDDPAQLQRIRWLWAFCERLSRPTPFRGLRRYKTLAEAQLDRERWELGQGRSGT